MSRLHAGAARVKLEPPLGIAMIGYGHRTGRASGVHDELAAQAIVISDGTARAAIISVDVLGIGARIADDIRAAIAAATEILADNVMVCATHTHSGPIFNIFATPKPDAKAGDDRDLNWERALPEKIARAAIEAHNRLEPATMRVGRGHFTLGTNRRLRRADGSIQNAPNYAGVTESELLALGFYSANGRALAYVFTYPCHGVVLCEDNLLYSRDWPGFALDEIESSAAGDGAIAIFLQGATGNIDPRSRGNFEVASENGRAAGRAVIEGLRGQPALEDEPLAIMRIPLALKLRDLDARLKEAHRCVAQTKASLENHRAGEGFQLKRLRDQHGLSLAHLAALETLEEQNRRDRRVDLARRELKTAMTILTIGGVAIIGIPGEPFVEFAHALKANSWFSHTLVVGYCNDLIGYIPTREAFAEGGYEVETARVGEDAGEVVMATALEALASIAAAAH
jgi:neutral ceramidase